MRGAGREDVIRTIQCGNTSALGLPELELAIMRHELLDVADPIDLLGPIR